jgi:outer membrane protein
LTLQYHFLPQERFSPYLGAGINYTVFFDEEEGAASSIDYEDSFGFALQAGIDYALSGNWSLNFDVKKVFLDTDVDTTVEGTDIEADVDIDPWIIGIGVGYRF